MLNKLHTSFRIFLALTTYMLMSFGLISCGETSSFDLDGNIEIPEDTLENEGTDSTTELELTDEEIATLFWETEDPSVVELIKDEDQLREVEKLLDLWEGSSSTNDMAPYAAIPGCGGYWGTYGEAGFAEYQRGGYSYYWSPNCSMRAADIDRDGKGDCGEDYNDNMVSFWLGPDYNLDMSAYRTDGTSIAVRLDLQYHTGGSFRMYFGNVNGQWYANAYVCLSDWLNAENLRFGRDY